MLHQTDKTGLEILKERLPKISAVEKYGFEYHGMVTSGATRSLPETYEFNFRKGDLSLEIGYIPNPVCIGAFVIEVSKAGQVESLNFAQWLKKQGSESWLEKFRLSRYSGDTEAKIDSFLAFLGSLLDEPEIKKVLQGDSWSDTPFDWGPNR